MTFVLQISDCRFQISDFRFQIADCRLPIAALQFQISIVEFSFCNLRSSVNLKSAIGDLQSEI